MQSALMFSLSRKRLVGSFLFFSATSRLLPPTIDVAHNRWICEQRRGRAGYVLSTVWFSFGDYRRLLLRSARLLSDHLRDCYATKLPRCQNPIRSADANVVYPARLSAERRFAGGHRCNAR